jgi:thiamine kinase-like enzyme
MSAGEKETEDGIRTRDIEALTVEMSPMMMKLMLKDTMKPFPKLLRNFNKDEDLIRRLEVYSRDRMIKRNLEISSTKKEMEKSRIVTLCHGDAWSNNMMFSEDESEVVLLDFQLMGLAHPARSQFHQHLVLATLQRS